MSESGITHCYLHGDVLTRSLRCLEWRDIITLRQVSSCWKLAARETHVEQEVYVQTRQALQILQTSLPKLQSLSLDQRSDDDVLEQDDEMSIPVIHRFSHLLHFQCVHRNPSPLRMVNLSALFASWPFLQSLNLHGNEELEWNLSDLICLKHLKDARFINNHYLRGNINDDLLYRYDQTFERRVPTDVFHNLESFDIAGCTQVTGELRHFSSLPKLQWLGINRTQIKGDLRTDIRPGDFVALQGIGLCSRFVYGASKIDSVQGADPVMRSRLQIMKQSMWDAPIWPFLVHLSEDAPEFHQRAEQRLYTSERDPPFSIEVVVVGKRLGWRWSNYLGGFCDTHWVDSDQDCPIDREEIKEFQKQQSLFSGYLQPPTPQQYFELCQDRLNNTDLIAR
jgi:hypothetical protein